MIQQKKLFITNLAVGMLGLVVGASNLLRWVENRLNTYSLILGIICTVCAIGWLIYMFWSKKAED